jgi:uncharacterized protein
VKAELEQLIALQSTDTSIRKIQSELDSIPQRRAEVEREFEQRAFEFREVEKRRDEAQLTRARLDKELTETRLRAERAERNLMASQNEQEYTAAIRELDASKKHASQLETQILEQMEILEQSEKILKERAPEIEKLRGELNEKLKEFEEQTHSNEEILAAKRTERDKLAATLPKQMSALYNRISARIRDGVAVAEARNGSCTSCFMVLRPQVMAEIRRGEEIIVCDNCSRILYYAPIDQSERNTPIYR